MITVQVYGRKMPRVWMRDDPKCQTRFHRTQNCRQLRKRSATGHARPLIEVDLEEVFVRPCRTCYPDAPAIRIQHRWCDVCRSNWACEHNGGVYTATRDGRHKWTWPDKNLMPLYRSLV